MRILLVEDDPVLQAVMLRSLADAGHRVDPASDLATATHLWRVQSFDAVLLDLNLPLTDHGRSDMGSGLTLLREMRAKNDKTPVLVLTARNRTDERIAGLDAGAEIHDGVHQLLADTLTAALRGRLALPTAQACVEHVRRVMPAPYVPAWSELFGRHVIVQETLGM